MNSGPLEECEVQEPNSDESGMNVVSEITTEHAQYSTMDDVKG